MAEAEYTAFAAFDDEDDYDPFADDGPTEDEDEGGDQVPDPLAPGVNPNPVKPAVRDDRPAEERLAELLAELGNQKRTCLGVLRLCEQPRTAEEVDARVAELQQGNYSVFGASNLAALLERAGGLERVTADGERYDEDAAEPDVVVVDGVEYLQASEPPQVFYRATAAGVAAAAADDPAARLAAALAEDGAYLHIYEAILAAASEPEGAKVAALIRQLDRDPALQKPRRSCTHFIERLREAEALDWRDAWFVNDVGAAALQQVRERLAERAAQEG